MGITRQDKPLTWLYFQLPETYLILAARRRQGDPGKIRYGFFVHSSHELFTIKC